MPAPQFRDEYLREFRDLLNTYLREVDQRLEASEVHQNRQNNPHNVTRAQLGAAAQAALDSHTATRDNPHAVTAAQAGAPPTSRTISTTAPLSGGGNLGANRTLSITPASQSAAGSMSAADKAKLDKIGTYANVRRDASLTVGSGVVTSIPMDVEVFDNGGFFTLTSATRFTVSEGGLYEIGLSAGYSRIVEVVERVLFDLTHLNAYGTAITVYRVEVNNAQGGNPRTAFSMPTRIEAGQHIEFKTFQNSGSAQTLTDTSATIARLG